ncbi:hypothetical protein KZX46_00740 (plasmid) [Polymorphobacter sp. PAMC 29334]|uniref:hypothetical protein n=1 Tax=Polymorphobacter sp. PAMC 29334 TaxID=2862331 RepID=UPI001C76C4CA|nr:hypothetical protein [Polymorphobacter sp. PAMC 29334]QYE33358.1 hypothetical protein KZX46_00740 [Polymorphobacter sp. PAMC 29334]
MPKKSAGEYGSIVSLIGTERVYGIRAQLTMPSTFRVNDKQELADMVLGRNGRIQQGHPDKYNYFDAYFSLCALQNGEDGRVEAGIFKYSGEEGDWHAIRTGVGMLPPHAPAPFHGKKISEHTLRKPCLIEVLFLPNDPRQITFKVDGEIIAGPMQLNVPISQHEYDTGGLFPKVSIGMCNYAGDISFGQTTFSAIEVTHSRVDISAGLRKWVAPKIMHLKTKFTNGDNILHRFDQHSFTGWMPPGPHARAKSKQLPNLAARQSLKPGQERLEVPFVPNRPMS